MKKKGDKGLKERERAELDPEVKRKLMIKESKEQIDAYYEHLKECIAFGICSECGQPVIFNELYTGEHIKEYSISGLCRECQIKEFGM